MYCDDYYKKYNFKPAKWPFNLDYRLPSNMPAELQAIVCDCKPEHLPNVDKYAVNWEYDRQRHLNFCIACHDIKNFHVFKCYSCSEFFIDDFAHPGYCALKKVCLDCFDAVPKEDHCTEHNFAGAPCRLVSMYDNYVTPTISNDDIRKFLDGF